MFETVVLKYLSLKVVDYDGMEWCEGYDRTMFNVSFF